LGLLWALGFLLVGGQSLYACDYCNVFVGVLPNDRLSRVDLFYRYSHFQGWQNIPGGNQRIGYFKTNHGGHVGDAGYQQSDRETFHTLELRGTFFATRWLSVMVGLPLQFATESVGGTRARKLSMGDLNTMLTFYPLWRERQKFSHRVGLMGGVKAPTGQFRPGDQPDANFFAYGGTGSWDFLLGAQYVFRYRKVGSSTVITTKLNTPNRDGYQMDHGVNVQQHFFANFNGLGKMANVSVVPGAGLYFEASNGLFKGNEWQEGTGGRLLFAQAQLEVFYKRFGANVMLRIPVWQQLFGAQMASGARLALGVNYSFGLKKISRKARKPAEPEASAPQSGT
jgi:hypothetical protein